MVQSTNIELLAIRTGQQDKNLRQLINLNAIDLAALTTTEKSSLVGAINEVNAALANGVTFNDAGTGTTDAWSAAKIISDIQAAVDQVVNGAPGVLDTLSEISAALQDNPNQITEILTAQAANTLSITAAQNTADQAVADAAAAQTTANMANATALAAQTSAAAAQTTANTNGSALTTLTADVGDTTTDFVAVFEAALV